MGVQRCRCTWVRFARLPEQANIVVSLYMPGRRYLSPISWSTIFSPLLLTYTTPVEASRYARGTNKHVSDE